MTNLPNHFLVSESDGHLYDTRRPEWHLNPPLRPNYCRHHLETTTLADVKASLRAGEFTWPGGYRLAFITQDGAVLSFGAVRDNFKEVVWDFHNGASTGWRIAWLINVDESEEPIHCDQTSEMLNAHEVLEVV